MTKLLHKELTRQIIRAYYDVYNGTSRTYPEYIYENGMMHDLRALRIPCLRQDEYEICYKDWPVGKQRLDIFVAGDVVVEIKVAPRLTRLHKAQTISYLKTTGKKVGLLFNFGGPEPEFERLYYEHHKAVTEPEALEQACAGLPAGYLSPELTYLLIGGLFEVHHVLGPGFIWRIYANACHHEFQLRELDVRPEKVMQVMYRGVPIGPVKFAHLRIENTMVFPVAIQDIADIRIDNLKDWMRVQEVPLGILANFHALSLKPIVLRI
jgi:GxxExxY protein